ncbi:UNKNOWN [Stylonychia lemnae]|uniref:Uncharacterized protein n=1 Tax=Stylonychia lemnae TaxID=5949 RepID=A0A078AGY4_STYLE|nr:UNKNOWN [Stylonychia lemnae]|eukprot:CDW80782.1 UNKNOWN [Stylonychia lemnae]
MTSQSSDQQKIQSFLDSLDEILNDRYEQQKVKYANEVNFDIDNERDIRTVASSNSGSNSTQSKVPLIGGFRWSEIIREPERKRKSSSPLEIVQNTELDVPPRVQLQLSEKKKPLAQERISQFTNASTNITNTVGDRTSLFGILTDRSRFSFANQAPPDLSRLSSAHENLLFDRKMPQLPETLRINSQVVDRNSSIFAHMRQNSENSLFEPVRDTHAQTSRHGAQRHLDFRAFSDDLPIQYQNQNLEELNEVSSGKEDEEEEEKKFSQEALSSEHESRKNSFQDRNMDTGNPQYISQKSKIGNKTLLSRNQGPQTGIRVNTDNQNIRLPVNYSLGLTSQNEYLKHSYSDEFIFGEEVSNHEDEEGNVDNSDEDIPNNEELHPQRVYQHGRQLSDSKSNLSATKNPQRKKTNETIVNAQLNLKDTR